MEVEDRGFDVVEGAICLVHIRDRHLVAALSATTADATCLVCGRVGVEGDDEFAVELDDLMVPVMEAIRFLYEPASSLPWAGEYIGPKYDGYDVIERVCGDAFEGDAYDVVFEPMVQALLGRDEWTTLGALAESDHLEYRWESFTQTVKHTSRFVYSDEGGATPGSSLFEFLSDLRVYVDGQLDLIDTLEQGTVVYRGRLVERRGDVKATAADLGPAPEKRATANRMSPAGISLLYASQDPGTAVAEIAAHGPKPRALIGGFRSTKPLKILDLTRQPKMPSVFDQGARDDYVMARSLRSFVRAVTAPVIPDGREHVDYVPTQVVTEYLRWLPATRVDGIALPSAQSHEGAKTYVFFVGPADVADAHTDPPTTGSSLLPDEPHAAVFTLDPSDVTLWDVVRTYAAQPASDWA